MLSQWHWVDYNNTHRNNKFIKLKFSFRNGTLNVSEHFLTITRAQAYEQIMPILSILIKCVAHGIRITEVNGLYGVLNATRNLIWSKSQTLRMASKSKPTQQVYLVLRIQITYENRIPNIEDQISSFPIKIWISHWTTRTRGTNRTNPTSPSIAFAATVPSNKTKCSASIAPSQQSSRCRPYPTASTETRRRRSWGWRRWLVLKMCQGYLIIQSDQQCAHMLR